MWDTKKQKVNQADVDNMTVLGKNVTFKGLIYFEGTLQLDSYVEGEIHAKGVLIVSEHAVIRGTISVGTLISSGKIQGTVAASDKVQLLKSAIQIGDVHAPTFSIEEGAYFKGSSDMGLVPSSEESSEQTNRLSDQTNRHDSAGLRLPEGKSGDQQLSHNAQDELIH